MGLRWLRREVRVLVHEFILVAYSNNIAHRSCWSSFQGTPFSLLKRAITDSSLSLATGGFYPIVSECCDERAGASYLLKL